MLSLGASERAVDFSQHLRIFTTKGVRNAVVVRDIAAVVHPFERSLEDFDSAVADLVADG
jgi:hypothetical protein